MIINSVSWLCDKKNEINQVQKRNNIQNKLYAQKFNQLASTFYCKSKKKCKYKILQ